MDLARSIQEVTEEILFRMARQVRRETGLPKLCLAGGVALNCVANGRILREGVFDELWIQPAAGDAGGALGAALAIWYQHSGNPRSPDGQHDTLRGALLGPDFGREQILEALATPNPGERTTELTETELAPRVASLLAAEKVVGWFQGRMEFGPRALGARSILGDARSAKMQSVMNLAIKFRESFRPFAPVVRLERVADWFDLKHPSPSNRLSSACEHVVQRSRRAHRL